MTPLSPSIPASCCIVYESCVWEGEFLCDLTWPPCLSPQRLAGLCQNCSRESERIVHHSEQVLSLWLNIGWTNWQEMESCGKYCRCAASQSFILFIAFFLQSVDIFTFIFLNHAIKQNSKYVNVLTKKTPNNNWALCVCEYMILSIGRTAVYILVKKHQRNKC